jgi:hypothetical protein
METYFETNGKKGVVQIGTHVLNVLYYFTEDDTIYCKVTDDNADYSFKSGYEFFTHYKSLLV